MYPEYVYQCILDPVCPGYTYEYHDYVSEKVGSGRDLDTYTRRWDTYMRRWEAVATWWQTALMASMWKSYLTECSSCLVLESQLPHQIVNLFFILVIIKDTLRDLCGN